MKKILGLSLLTLSLISTSAFAMETPQTGISKASVEIKYGNPIKQVAAIGQPPISSWIYKGFTVYFEGNRVIHTVMNTTKK